MEAILYGLWAILAVPIALMIGRRMGREEAQRDARNLAESFQKLAGDLLYKLAQKQAEIERLESEKKAENRMDG